MSAGKCGACEREFTGLTAFDKHQDVDYMQQQAVICRDPATLGLVQDRNGRWGSPADEASRLRLASLRAEQGVLGVPGRPEAAQGGSGPRETNINEGDER